MYQTFFTFGHFVAYAIHVRRQSNLVVCFLFCYYIVYEKVNLELHNRHFDGPKR